MKQLILFLLILIGITSCDTLYYDSWYYSDYYRRPTILVRPDPPVKYHINSHFNGRRLERNKPLPPR